MIRVTVELVSANGRHRDRILGEATITNDETGERGGNGSHANYVAEFFGGRRDTPRGPRWRGPIRLFGWPRNRHHPWLLVLVVLLKAVGTEQLQDVLRALRKSGARERARLGLHGAQPGDVDPLVAKRMGLIRARGFKNVFGFSKDEDGTKRYVVNRQGDVVEVDADGRCTDCGSMPENCRDEHK